jgi:nucleotide-binding universal stress UspA family protein
MNAFPRRIVVGFDGSEPARRALERVADVTADEASVVLVRVAQPLYSDPRAASRSTSTKSPTRERTLTHGKDLLAERGVAARTLFVVGDPRQFSRWRGRQTPI